MQARTAIKLSTLGAVAALLACDSSRIVDPPAIPTEAHAMRSGPPVTAPSGTKATAISVSQIDISWQDRSSNETGFEVRRYDGANFVTVATTAANVVAFSDRGLQSSTSYCYDVRALRVVGPNTLYSTFSISACATTLAPPPPPPPPPPTPASNVTATPFGSTAVELTWTADSTATGFLIQRSSDGGATWPVTMTAAWPRDLAIDDRPLPSEQMVCYRVVATNTGGAAPPSNTACTVPPAAPSLFTATPVDPQTVELNWVDNSNVENGYVVSFYKLLRDEFGQLYLDGWTLAALPPNATTVRVAPATCDLNTVWGYYSVVATKDGGHSDESYATICGAPPPGGAVNASVQLARRRAPSALGHPARGVRSVRNR